MAQEVADLTIAAHFPCSLIMVSSRRQSTAGRKRRASEAPAGRKRKPEEEAVVEEEPQEEAPREVKRRVSKESEELKPVSHSSHGKVGDAEPTVGDAQGWATETSLRKC